MRRGERQLVSWFGIAQVVGRLGHKASSDANDRERTLLSRPGDPETACQRLDGFVDQRSAPVAKIALFRALFRGRHIAQPIRISATVTLAAASRAGSTAALPAFVIPARYCAAASSSCW
jgi:hypothetical protein